MVGPKVAQGDVYWYDFAEPRGSEPRFERPVAILQGDALNRTTIQTAVVIVLTSNLRAASEFDAAAERYESLTAGLGGSFIDEVEAIVARIE